jgi:hypothetical protein
MAAAPLELHQGRQGSAWGGAENQYAVPSSRGASMKLHVKIAVLIAYVALCTHMVLTALEAEPAVAVATLPYAIGE